MNYKHILQILCKIDTPIYVPINANSYIQGNKVIDDTPWFHSIKKREKKPYEKKQQSVQKEEVIVFTRLFEVFVKLINPLATSKDVINELCPLLQKNINLLKTITPHYKKFMNEIIMNAQSTVVPDTSFTSPKYMLFWSNLFNAKIYIIEGSMYKVYGDSTKSASIIIRVVNHKFEYINGSFMDFQLKHNVYEYIDTSNLQSKTIAYLHKICKIYKIDITDEQKKKDLISKIEEKIR
jgi:hypothetical protein